MTAWILVMLLGLMSPQGAAQVSPPAAQKAVQEQIATTFQFAPSGDAVSVYVAGTFNRWDKGATPLQKQPDGKTWRTVLRLEPGVYQYKFVVNGNTWLTDPGSSVVDDGNGNQNSQRIVYPHGYNDRPGKLGDGYITGSAVLHRVAAPYVVREDRRHIALVLRTRRDDVARCWLTLWQPNSRSAANRAKQASIRAVSIAAVRERRIPMTRSGQDALFDYWRAVAPLPARGVLRYAFRLQDGPNPRLYDAGDWVVAGNFTPRWFTLEPKNFPPFDTPDWVRDAVFYQIFPERFANGDTSNDPADVQPWGSKPAFNNWMGGDIAGVMQHLEYLRDLGINALYFNPIFSARSNHGYDTTDPHTVAPAFGTNDTLTELTTRAHEQGWHVILDGVFNHSGVDFFAFKSLREEGEKSPYRNWYFVKGFPIEVKDGQQNYLGWFGTPWLPKLNVLNPETRDYLLDVGMRWLKDAHIDGWRLDAADEVPHDFWKAFRKAVREVNPHAYIVGEIWGNASDWLQGDQFDGVMNYRWRGAALDFFVFDKITPGQFNAALSKIAEDYPPAATAAMLNILDSHDTERLRTLCKGDWSRQKQAVLFQMTYPGAPCIYYGDEIGMEGGRDPDNRRAMEWDQSKWNHEILDFYRRTIGLRRKHPVLTRGHYETLVADDKQNIFAFRRYDDKESVVIVFNRSDQEQTVTLPTTKAGKSRLFDWLEGDAKIEAQADSVRVTLPPHGIALLGP